LSSRSLRSSTKRREIKRNGAMPTSRARVDAELFGKKKEVRLPELKGRWPQ